MSDNYERAMSLRNEHRACLKLAGLTDSKKEDAHLREEAAKALAELKSICPHLEVVILRSEYSGSYSEDYDDRNPEERKCLICGVVESKYRDSRREQFEILKNEHTKWRFEGKYPDQVKNPLGYLLSECTEAAATGYRPRLR